MASTTEQPYQAIYQKLNKVGSFHSVVDKQKQWIENEHEELNIRTKLKLTQDMMHKLKFNFVELATKQKFLENIQLSAEKDIIPTDQKVADCEIATAQAKNQVKRSKKHTQALFQQLENLASEWVQKQNMYRRYQQLCQYKLKQLQAWGQQENQKDSLVDRNGYHRQFEYMDEANAKELLHEREEQLSELAAQKQQLETKRNDILWELKPMEIAVEQLKNHVTALEHDAKQNIHEDDTRSRMKEIMNWYDNLIQLVQTMSGVTIDMKDDNDLKITIAKEINSIVLAEEHDLIITWSKTKPHLLTGVELNPADVNIDDIVQKWKGIEHVPYLVRHILQRLHEFQGKLQEMRNAYEMEIDLSKSSSSSLLHQQWTIQGTNIVRLSINEQLFLDLQFDPGYPEYNTGFQLVRFYAATEQQSQWWKSTNVWKKLTALNTNNLIEWQTKMRETIRETLAAQSDTHPTTY